MQDEIPFFVPFDGVNFPKNAKVYGKYLGQNYYIGRAHHHGSLTPGIVLEDSKTCLIPWGTVSNSKNQYEILIGGCEKNWVVAKRGDAPLNAFEAGHSEQGETLFIGRYKHQSEMIAGKVQPSHHVCYIPYNGHELNSNNYEIFVI